MKLPFLDWKRFRIILLFCLLISTINIFEAGIFQSTITLLDLISRWVLGFLYLSFSFIFIQLVLFGINLIPLKLPNNPWLAFSLVNVLTCFLLLTINNSFRVRPINSVEIYFGVGRINITILRVFVGQTLLYFIYNFLVFIEERKSIQLQNEQLQTENLKIQFEVLKQQTNPHFLFNALNTLRVMVREQDPHSEEFIIKLSSLYRALLNKKDLPYISLKEELEFTEAYIFLLKSRFQENLQVHYSLISGTENLLIPTFALQILVENCVKHNIISQNRPLMIHIEQNGLKEIAITNNLQLKSQKPEISGIGLVNLINRYNLLNIENGVEKEFSEAFFKVKLKLFEI